MKNHKLTISLIFLGVMLAGMVSFAVMSRAAGAGGSRNPYDDPDLSTDDMIDLYHINMNQSFNDYILLLMTNLPGENPTCKEKDPGNAYTTDCKGHQTPLTVTDCLDPKNSANYSSFCVAVNLLGADSDQCPPANKPNLKADMLKFCDLNDDERASKGYLNFVAALKKRSNKVFDTRQDDQGYSDYLETVMSGGLADPQGNKTAAPYYQNQKSLEIANKLDQLEQETVLAKQALDQTLSAYDQLKTAWPMHEKYTAIYNNLEKYRDRMVDLRHQTDAYPKKFIDLTTTACL